MRCFLFFWTLINTKQTKNLNIAKNQDLVIFIQKKTIKVFISYGLIYKQNC